MHLHADLKGNMVVPADGFYGRTRRHRTRWKSAARHDPLADLEESLKARQGVGKRLETRTGQHEPAFLRTLPVAGISNHGGWSGDIRFLYGASDSGNASLKNVDYCLGNTALFRIVLHWVIASKVFPIAVVASWKHRCYGRLAHWSECRIEVEETKAYVALLSLGIDSYWIFDNTGEHGGLIMKVQGDAQ